MLNLHNLSEEISNAQTERAARMGEVSNLSYSCMSHPNDAWHALLLMLYMSPEYGPMQVEMSTRSTNRSFKKLITERDDVSPEDIYKALCEQEVELIFTAHPTQVGPRCMLATCGQGSLLDSTAA